MRSIASLLVMAMMITALPSTAMRSYAAPEEAGDVNSEEASGAAADAMVFDVTQYGANPAGGNDASVGVYKAIEAAKEYQDSHPGEAADVIIRFPEGRYDFYPDKVKGRILYPSNTNNGGINGSQGNMNGANSNALWFTKYIGISIDSMRNVTVEGNNSSFVYHGNMTPFASINSQNVVFKDFTSDFQAPLTIDFTVLEVDRAAKTAKVRIPECYDVTINNNNFVVNSDKSPYNGVVYYSRTVNDLSAGAYCKVLDATDNVWLGSSANLMASRNRIEPLTNEGKNVFRITYNSLDEKIREGLIYQIRQDPRRTPGTFIWKSDGVTLKDINYYYMHGFGIVAQQSANLFFNSIDFGPPKETGRAAGGFADFMQISGCGGKVVVDNCTFANPQDDPINMHGTFVDLKEVDENDRKKVTVYFTEDGGSNETFGFPNFFPGNKLELSRHSDTMAYTTEGTLSNEAESGIYHPTVISYEGPDGNGGLCRMTLKEEYYRNGAWINTNYDPYSHDIYDYEDLGPAATGRNSQTTDMKLILDKAVPSGVAVGHNVTSAENLTYIPEIEIKNSLFKEAGPRGILLKARKSIKVHNNEFDGIQTHAIMIQNPKEAWRESGRVLDLEIYDNVFKRGPYENNDSIRIEGSGDGTHKNIRIHDNIFYLGGIGEQNNRPYSVLNASGVHGLEVKDNKILWLEPNKEVVFADDNERNISKGDYETIVINEEGGPRLNISGKKNENAALFTLNNTCKGVKFSGNTYDGGVDARLNPGSAEVLEKDADLATNTNKVVPPYSQVIYESDAPEVLKVTSAGKVLALQEGTANITAYVISGGRKYKSSNKLTYKVTDGEVVKPSVVIHNSTNENLNEETTSIQYSSEVTMSESQYTGHLNWSVKDAVNGGDATTLVTLSNETNTGATLTKVNGGNGVAVVKATDSASGESGSKLTSVYSKAYNPSKTLDFFKGDEAKAYVNALEDGVLRVKAKRGDVYKAGNDVNALLGKKFSSIAEGDIDPVTDIWRAEVDIKGNFYSENYRFAGIIVYVDQDNYIMGRRQARPNNKEWIANCFEYQQSDPNDGSHKKEYNRNVLGNSITIGIEKTDENTVKVFHKTENGAKIYEDPLNITDNNLSAILNNENLHVGLIVGGTNEFEEWFEFSNFKLTKLESEDASANESGSETEESSESEEGEESPENEENEGSSEGGTVGIVKNITLTEEVIRPTKASNITIEKEGNRLSLSVAESDSSRIVKWAASDKESEGGAAPKDYTLLDGGEDNSFALEDPNLIDKYITAAVVHFNDRVPSEIAWSNSYKVLDADINGESEPDDPTSVNAFKSSDAYLSDMKILIGGNDITSLLKRGGVGATESGFDSKVYSYNYYISNPNGKNDLTYSVTPSDEKATVTVTLRKQNSSGAEKILSGANLLEFKVVAEDGYTTKIYRVNITRKGSDDARLRRLVINGITEITNVDNTKREFNYTVSGESNAITVEALPNSNTATVAIAGETGLARIAEDGVVRVVDLVPGDNTINVMVTPESGGLPEKYTIHVYRHTSNNAKLQSLSVTDGVLDKAVSEDIKDYTAIVEAPVTTITAASRSTDSTVRISLADKKPVEGKGVAVTTVALNDEADTLVTIDVISQDETVTETYNLIIKVKNWIDLTDLDYFSRDHVLSSAPWINMGQDKQKLGLVRASTDNLKVPNTGVDYYDKGLVMHPDTAGQWAKLTYVLDNEDYRFTRFEAITGIEKSVNRLQDGPTATFAVEIDGVEVPAFNNGTEKTYTATINSSTGVYNGPAKLSVDIPENASRLTIKIKRDGSNNAVHAGWADARLYYTVDKAETIEFRGVKLYGEDTLRTFPNGTSLATIIKELPTAAIVLTSNGELSETVNWHTDNLPYSIEKMGEQTFTIVGDVDISNVGFLNDKDISTTVKITVKVEAADISKDIDVEEVEDYVYTGSAITPKIQVYDNGIELTEADYVKKYKNNINAGTATITVTGKGNYKGTETREFTILPKSIGDEDIIITNLGAVANGKVQRLKPVITYNNKKLKAGLDYEVVYSDNGYSKPGQYKLTVYGKGNFQGTRELTQEIVTGKLVSKLSIKNTTPKENLVYTGNNKTTYSTGKDKLQIIVNDGSTPLTEGIDYRVEYKDNVEVGTATVTIKGIMNLDKDSPNFGKGYAGEKSIKIKISGIALKSTGIAPAAKNYYYTPDREIVPEITSSPKLEEGVDYTVSYDDTNRRAGTATVVFTGKGLYTGVVKKTFKILPLSVDDSGAVTDVIPEKGVVEINDNHNIVVEYAKGGAKPVPSVVYKEGLIRHELTLGKDYTLSYKNQSSLAEANKLDVKKKPTVTITMKGNYKGKIVKYYDIVAKDIGLTQLVTADKAWSSKPGSFISSVSLLDVDGKKLNADKDYVKEVEYFDAEGNKLSKTSTVKAGDVITVKVKAKAGSPYTGEKTDTYRVTSKLINKVKVTVEPQDYTGEDITLEYKDLSVFDGKTRLVGGRDFEIVSTTYKNNRYKGNASVTIKGINNYGGTKNITFKIGSKGLIWWFRDKLTF